jgi:sterol desaturase/sphingolipid hydroxylase (fatty acid hydroxylase superfamily)
LKESVSILVLAFLLCWESFHPFFHHFGSVGYRIRHGLRNLFLGIINSLAIGLLLAWGSRQLIGYVNQHAWGFFQRVHMLPWVQTLFTILVFDLILYWWHRANHGSRFLWRFHRTHHSDREMDVTSASRFHFGEIAMAGILRLVLISLLGPQFSDILIYETSLFCIVQFHHSNISLGPLDRPLAMFFVTPDIHRVHHSRLQGETDSNYSSLLSVWDRLFRTRKLRSDQHAIRLGLDEFGTEKDQTLPGLLKTPFQ